MSEDDGVSEHDDARADRGRSAHDVPRTTEPVHLEGGEPACWLQRVCPECGALTEPPAITCWRCGREIGDTEDDEPRTS